MLVLVGLGNPGTEYAKTRHNIGFMAADEIARRYSFTPFRHKLNAAVATGQIGDTKVILVKPETFMNNSGEAVLAVCSFYHIRPEDVIVLHDDMDLPPGKVKVKRGGSAGGHNGLKSIDSHIGSAYRRVRIGIGRPADKVGVVDWVLTPFNTADREIIDSVLGHIAEHITLLTADQDQTFMNRLTVTSA